MCEGVNTRVIILSILFYFVDILFFFSPNTEWIQYIVFLSVTNDSVFLVIKLACINNNNKYTLLLTVGSLSLGLASSGYPMNCLSWEKL